MNSVLRAAREAIWLIEAGRHKMRDSFIPHIKVALAIGSLCFYLYSNQSFPILSGL